MAMEKAEEPNMHATMNVENIRPYGGTCARGGSLPSSCDSSPSKCDSLPSNCDSSPSKCDSLPSTAAPARALASAAERVQHGSV
jgi:hypothetical protein